MGLIGLIMSLWALPLAVLAQDDSEPTTVDDDPEPIIVGGNIYGGGNKGIVEGNTTVNVRAGDLNKVFGGARMADVGGRSFVNIDGEHATDFAVINQVYGGNDIGGHVGAVEKKINNVPTLVTRETTVPAELKAVKRETADANDKKKNDIDNTWKTFVHISAKMDASDPTKVAADNKPIYIGQLFAGGNGEYVYTNAQTEDNTG